MPLHGLRWFAGAAVIASGVAGACGYPNFTYGSGGNSNSSSSSGVAHGGAGGGGAPATSTTMSATATSSTASSSSSASAGGGGSAMKGQVSCTADETLCNPGQVCCVSESDTSCDKCFDDTTCEDNRTLCQQAPYDVYECDSDADCGASMHCCAQIISGEIVQQVRCYSHACSDQTQTRQMCHDDNDCDAEYPSCSDFSYPPYQVCE